jgi:hypothetical protein
MYGDKSPYFTLIGRDATLSLAKMDLSLATTRGDGNNKNNNGGSDGSGGDGSGGGGDVEYAAALAALSADELVVLSDWKNRFEKQYPIVGRLPMPLPTSRL